ncbi:hypothetical protein HF086_000175 [Spodoptera exigua]|uniref:Uncharacterized protein n=1 Tax=Spodoptera exigua TaxID=7107 RepID=A0A922M0F8_SPOEX|nr:hypothetical protein HF086_000175 [Spodoptera exigua]
MYTLNCRSARHLLVVDGTGVGSSSARALTPAERAVLPASFPSSERASENVSSRSTARRRHTEGFPVNLPTTGCKINLDQHEANWLYASRVMRG